MKHLNIDRINAKAPYRFFAAIIVENRNPLLTDITADFDQTAVSLTNKPSE